MHLQPILTHTTILFSLQYLVNHRRLSPVHCKIGFVLDDSAQLQANMSVLSMCKGRLGYALTFGRLGVFNAFLMQDIFN